MYWVENIAFFIIYAELPGLNSHGNTLRFERCYPTPNIKISDFIPICLKIKNLNTGIFALNLFNETGSLRHITKTTHKLWDAGSLLIFSK
jgi:hypothetical protein